MGSWPQGIGAVTLFVEDLGAAKRFYGEVFGLPVHFEDEDSVVFDFGNTLVNLLETSAAGELVEPATVADRGAGRARCSPSRLGTWTRSARSSRSAGWSS